MHVSPTYRPGDGLRTHTAVTRQRINQGTNAFGLMPWLSPLCIPIPARPGKSHRRISKSQPHPWQGRALPLSYYDMEKAVYRIRTDDILLGGQEL